ncbi:hypothetical protein [Salibacterium lacus]|uniref:Tail fiber domain-containing protein n=1 Tax=Salibacterium lacus TaxID=1898109 RepID=A0ABW5SY07_9BACI
MAHNERESNGSRNYAKGDIIATTGGGLAQCICEDNEMAVFAPTVPHGDEERGYYTEFTGMFALANAPELADTTKGTDITAQVDMAEMIRGLKAIQREAKAATQALREAEAADWTQHETVVRWNDEPDYTYMTWAQNGDEVDDIQSVQVADVLRKAKTADLQAEINDRAAWGEKIE